MKQVMKLISQYKFLSQLEIGASFAYQIAERLQQPVRRLQT